MHPGLVRIISLGVVFGGWTLTAIGGYLRGRKKVQERELKYRSTPRPVNCKHLVPPLQAVPRWHCRVGDWYEGDCVLLHGAEGCTYKEEQ